MSGFFASVNGQQIVAGSLLIPLIGTWTADVHLATQQQVTGAATVVIGNLTLVGHVFRSDSYGGQVRARIVGGYGGWRQPIPAQGYGSSAGVGLGTVLNDAANACGEQLGTVNNTTVGNGFARVRFPSSVASDVLWQLVALGFIQSWYVAPSGETNITPWPTTTVQTPFTVTDQRPDEGLITVATEDYASWMPGCQFTSPLLTSGETFTSAGVQYVWDDGGKFRFEVLTGTTEDRVLGPIQQIVDARVSPLRFFGRYSYTVSNPTDSTIDATPIDQTLGLPDLQNVPLRADSIASVTPSEGCECRIMFADGKPTAPECVWVEADSDNGPAALTIVPQSQDAPPIARVNDTIACFFPPLMQIAGTVSGAPFIGVLTITSPAVGVIQTGSATANCG